MPFKDSSERHTNLTNYKNRAFARLFRFVQHVHGVQVVPDFAEVCMVSLWIGTQKGHQRFSA